MRKHLTKHRSKTPFKYKKLKKDLHWLDAVSQTGWISTTDMDNSKPSNVVSSQMWVYKDTKEFITLFGTYSYDEKGEIEFGEVITIPKKWV
tara:strand:- start:145 stop:417 length:273 start_codon:yes stop_codon:yes gene_type:complete